jgi:HK97 family phage portal protein
VGRLFGGVEKRAGNPFAPPPVPPTYLAGAGAGSVDTGANPGLAMAVPAVWAAVSLLAGTVSQLPLQTMRNVQTGIPVRVPDGPLIESPSQDVTLSTWLHQVMVSLLLRGNAYGQIVERGPSGLPTQISLVNPDALDVRYSQDGVLEYRNKRTRELIDPESLWHLAGLSMPGSRIGMSPIAYGAATLGIDLASRRFAKEFFEGGGIPKAVLASDLPISADQAHTVKQRFMAQFRAREPVVLGAGLTYTQIAVNPEESQFLATMNANVAQVARFFGIPSDMIDGPSGTGMTYGNREQRSLDYLTYSVGPWLKRIEDSLFPLFVKPVFVRFDTAALLRSDAQTRATIHLQYMAAKVLAPSEVREDLTLPPMTEAQKTEAGLVPLDITPMGKFKPVPGAMAQEGTAPEAPATDEEAGPPL